MSAVVTAPSATVAQVSGRNASRETVLAVLAKRTYVLVPGKPLALAREQLPLRKMPVIDAEKRNLLVTDQDCYPYKPRTDVVVRGHVHAPGKKEIVAEIGVGDVTHRILAIGDRKVTRTGSTITFGEPKAVGKVPLTFEHAYGGWDRRAEEKYGHPMANLARYAQPNTDLHAYSPFVYPRNRHGRGYVLDATDETLAELLLPNLEDPADRLTPGRLVLAHWRDWTKQPLPAATTWVSPGYYGRGIFGGMRPFWEPIPEDIAEVKRKLVPREALDIDVTKGHPLLKDLACGAPLGLQLPYVKPGTPIRLANLHPGSQSFTVSLPIGTPKISVDGRDGKLLPTEPVIHHVEIEPDEGRLSIVWRGSAPARRDYHPQELERMPLRVEWTEAR